MLVRWLVRLKFVFGSIRLAWIFSLSWWNQLMCLCVWGHVWTHTLSLFIKTAHSNVLVHTDPQFCGCCCSFLTPYWLLGFNTSLLTINYVPNNEQTRSWLRYSLLKDLCGQTVRHVCLPPWGIQEGFRREICERVRGHTIGSQRSIWRGQEKACLKHRLQLIHLWTFLKEFDSVLMAFFLFANKFSTKNVFTT